MKIKAFLQDSNFNTVHRNALDECFNDTAIWQSKFGVELSAFKGHIGTWWPVRFSTGSKRNRSLHASESRNKGRQQVVKPMFAVFSLDNALGVQHDDQLAQ